MICPLCNGLQEFRIECVFCGGKAEDKGPMEDYYGPYSPYEDTTVIRASISSQDEEQWCWHGAFCPHCNRELSPLPISRQIAP